MKSFFYSISIISVLSLATFHLAVAGGGFVNGDPGLNPEQRAQMRKAFADSTELAALVNKVAAAKKEALEAALDKSATAGAVREKLEAVAKIQTAVAMLRYRTGVKTILPSLSDEQKAWQSLFSGSSYNRLFVGNMPAFEFRGGISDQIENSLGESAEMTALSNKVATARAETVKVALNKDATDAAVREQVEAVAKIQTEIAMLRYQTATKAAPPEEEKTGMLAASDLSYNRLFVGTTSGLEVVRVGTFGGFRRGDN